MTDALGRLATALSGRYRLERELGQGGMATVYLAQDLKHDRKVAIKVLRPELAAVIGAERFLTEIKTTANLQHPHILPLHDSGESDGFLFYVMPYVEGESLRDRLNREKQLPINDAVRISVEVAGALDYAHRHNVIHRDIKPENILLHDGRALVADFGIALAASKAGSTRMTETGMSLGTPHYMSPEQAMGEREITARSDVYALGCVTYELLCGEPPFGGPTAQAIVAKVLTEEPRPLLPKRHTIPPHVEAAVLTALEKLPADRFATAAEYAAALNDPTGTAHGPRGTLISRAYPRPRRETMVVRGALAGCLLLGAAAAWGWFRPRPAPPVTTLGLSLTPAPDPNGQVALTPDGERLVYQASGASVGTGRLWVKARGRVEATPLSGTDSAIAFALSPDSKWVAFQRGAHLFKVSLDGGAITPLADSVFGVGTGLAWLDDGTIFFTSSQSGRSRLARIPEAGGPLTELLDLDSIRRVPVLMTPLPGARGVLFAACAVRCSPGDLWVYDAVTRSGKQLVRDAAQGWYLPTGELVYVDHAGQLFAAPFDLKHLELRGTPVPVQSGVGMQFGIIPILTFSRAGTMVMQANQGSSVVTNTYGLYSVDRSGGRQELDTTWRFQLTQAGGNVGFALSPDGTRVAIGLYTGSGDDIWIKHLPAGALSRLTLDSTAEARPRWTPDGRFVSYIVEGVSLARRRADGTGESEPIHTSPQTNEGIWTRDGRWLVFRTGGQTTEKGIRNIYGIRTGDTTVVPLAADPRYDESSATVSPDGRWLAYVSTETGETEVYVRPFPNVNDGKTQVSVHGGQAPLWAHSGRELFYVDADRNMVVVPVRAGPAFVQGEPKQLFKLNERDYLNLQENYTPIDITPDDRRFLLLSLRGPEAGSAGAPSYLYVENWFESLKMKTAVR